MKKNLYGQSIKVYCKNCGPLDEDETKFLNIKEDMQGADAVTFECPKCKTVQKSRRYGRCYG